MNSEELKELRSTVTALLDGPNAELRERLDDSGWDEFVLEEPEAAVTVLFEEHGRTLGRSTVLDSVILTALGGATTEASAVAYKHQASPGVTSWLLLAHPSDSTVVAALDTDGTVSTFRAGDASIAPVPGFDPYSTWFTASVPAAALVATPAMTGVPALRAGRRSVAAELVGISRAILRLAAEHTTARHQYGHPIASFQTVRHRLADAYTAIEGASALVAVAFESDNDTAAWAAKAAASRAAELTSRHSIQVFGAIGSTQEHVLHRYVARAAVLNLLLGSSSEFVQAAGQALFDDPVAPRLGDV
jgi:hypothetical protein